MPDSLHAYLQQEMVCEGLLECFHGLKPLDRAVFEALATAAEPLTVDDVAARVERERSTAYRSVQRLLAAGLVQQDQINYEEGGYCHVYRATDADEIADQMRRTLNDWYAQMGQLIQTFRDRYGTTDKPVTVES